MSYQLSTQVETSQVQIDGKDVSGIFVKVAVYENIYSPLVTGQIVLLDGDHADFIGKNNIEGNEKIQFSFNSINDTLEFEGYLNGLRNKTVDNSNTLYTFDFTTEPMRKNEGKFITKRFKNKSPKEIVEEMVEEMGGKTDKMTGSGMPMSFLGSRWRPTRVIQYVLTHGVAKQEGGGDDESKKQDEKSKGLTGFLCWETLDGYRFAPTDDVLKGSAGTNVGSFDYRMQSLSEVSVDDSAKSILSYDFQYMGDMQAKLRSGAFKNVLVSFDIDKGLYKEFEYDGSDEVATSKQKEAAEKPTRYMNRIFANECYEEGCDKAQKDKYDQSRQYLSQNAARQNTAPDQQGAFTLPPQFKARAGDTFDAKIHKVETQGGGGYNKKHSGKYVIKQVGHHIFNDGKAYTKLTTIRSTTQQDDSSS